MSRCHDNHKSRRCQQLPVPAPLSTSSAHSSSNSDLGAAESFLQYCSDNEKRPPPIVVVVGDGRSRVRRVVRTATRHVTVVSLSTRHKETQTHTSHHVTAVSMLIMMLLEKSVTKLEELAGLDMTYFLLAYACVVLMILGVPLAIFLQNQDAPADRQLFLLEANRPMRRSNQGGDCHRRQDARNDSIA